MDGLRLRPGNRQPATGNRLTVTNHATTAGGTDQQASYSYPVGASAGQPHAVTDIATATAPACSGTYTQTGASHYSYDPSGRTLVRPGLTLSWDAEGHLASTTSSSGTQTNIYDADGNLLVQSDPVGGSTLYLGDTELHTAPGSTTVTGVRTYTANGMPLAERIGSSAAPVGSSTLYWLDSDGHGTAGSEVQALTLATTHRYTDPFGNSRGSGQPWTSSHTFLNAPADIATGTVQLGAREYDPMMGRFLSVDPLLDPTDPGQANGYSYASNDPVNASDPTGLMLENEGGGDCGSEAGLRSCQGNMVNHLVGQCESNGGSQDVCQHNAESSGGSIGSVIHGAVQLAGTIASEVGKISTAIAQHPGTFLSQASGLSDALKCLGTGSRAACAQVAVDGVGNFVAVIKIAKIAKLAELADFIRATKTRRAAKSVKVGAAATNLATETNLAAVTEHLKSIDALASHPPNAAMISRIQSAVADGRALTPGEQNFMTHELTEANAMARGVPQDLAHEMAGQTHPLFQNYDPEVIKQFPEYFNSNWRKAWGLP